MTRLIDADALKKQVKELLDLADKRVDDTPTNSPCYRIYLEQSNERARFVDLIDNTPTVELTETEIQEVLNKRCMSAVTNEYLIALHTKRPRGKWINDDNDLFDFKKCSNCGECAEWLDGGSQLLSNFCPNCGARMEVKK